MNSRGADEAVPTVFGYSLRELQPRLVLASLLGGSLAGVRVAHLGEPPHRQLFWWVLVVSNATLVGGLYWRVVLFERAAFGDDVDPSPALDRWRRIETWTVPVFALSGVVGVTTGEIGVAAGSGGVAVVVGVALASLVWSGRIVVEDGSRPAVLLRSGLLLSAVVALAGLAWMETGTTAVAWVVRLGHVGAFAIWVGGATWHNAVIRPTIRSTPSCAEALRSQASRFRRQLPVVVLALLVTGGYQTATLLGSSVVSLLDTHVGWLVTGKLVILAALTGMVVRTLRRA